jgi:hypothetical protein
VLDAVPGGSVEAMPKTFLPLMRDPFYNSS